MDELKISEKEETEFFPLTDIQWAYVVGRKSQFESNDVSSHIYMELKNNWDIQRFEKALNKVIEKHSMLRAVIHNDCEQYILKNPPYYKVEVQDISGFPEEEKQNKLKAFRAELSHETFDVSKWPLFTFKAVKLSKNPELHQVYLSMDMILSDAVGWELVMHDLHHFYENPDYAEPKPEKEFKDYVYLSKQEQFSQKYQQDKNYWLEKIKTMGGLPSLPFNNSGLSDKTEFKHCSYIVEKDCWNRIKKQLSKDYLLPSSLFAACYAKVLSKWSGNSEITLNLPVTNRTKYPGFYNVVGDFTSVMLLPLSIDNNLSLKELIKTVQKDFVESYKHSSFPGTEVMREFEKKYRTGKAANFPIVFTSLLGESRESQTAQWMGSIEYMISQTPQVFLDCQVAEQNGRLMLSLDFPKNLYYPNDIETLFGQYVKLVLSVDAENKIEEAEIFNVNNDLLKKIEDYNNSKKEWQEITLQQLVEKALNSNSEKILLCDDKSKLTYSQVNEKSLAYAQYLAEKGVTKGDLVAVCARREIETIIKILGIIRCGAGYVPVNPGQPEDVVEFILNECKSKLYLKDQSFEEISRNNYRQKFAKSDLKDTAYIIYTSGSTGMPKGVKICNQAVCNTLYDINDRFKITENDVVLSVSSFCFDLSVYDIFGLLLAGGTIVLAKDKKDSDELKFLMEKWNVTVWNSVPAIMELLLLSKLKQNSKLRVVMLSGDWIPLNLPQKIKDVFCNADLYSLGGATEASIWSIYYKINEIDENWKSIPYGYPLANQTIYVMDNTGNPCPQGVPGEICIGGKGVADEYLNLPEVNKKAFFVHKTYGRLYRTGDKGIFSRENYVLILGRIDQMLKKNGYRIDTGQIEKVLEEMPLLQKAVVDVKKINDIQQLVAFILPEHRTVKADYNQEQLVNIIKKLESEFLTSTDTQKDVELRKELFSISLESMLYSISRLCKKNGIEGKFSFENFISKASVPDVYVKLLRRWFKALEKENLILKENNLYELKNSADEEYFEGKVADFLEKISVDNKEIQESTEKYYFNCLTKASEILSGKQKALEFLFENGSYSTASNLYEQNSTANELNSYVASCVYEYTKGLNHKPKILEAGSGIGATTQSVLQKLNKDIDYTFTDISNYFLSSAKERFSDYKNMSFRFFNLDEDIAKANLREESFDVIIGANVVHDTKDIAYSLNSLKKLLVPGGMLILLEVTSDTYFHMVSSELLEGYSAYNDFRLKNDSALIDGKIWKECFTKQNYENICVIPNEEKPNYQGQNVIVGFKPFVKEFLTEEEISNLKLNIKNHIVNYMEPNIYVQLEKLPLSSNGKINKKLLPEVYAEEETNDFVKPETQTEVKIYEIYSKLSNISNFSLNQDFFLIGGDSLMMLKLLQKIKENYSLEISIPEFLECGNLMQVCKLIDKKAKEA